MVSSPPRVGTGGGSDTDDIGWRWLLASQPADVLLNLETPFVMVVASTLEFRQLARSLVSAEDHVIEVGSSLGLCTEILQARAASVLGVDVSLEQLAESRRRVPGASFEFLDIFEEAERLREMPCSSCCSVAFLDIGGDRRLRQVVHAVEILRRECLPSVKIIAVKSEELHASMAAVAGSAGDREGTPLQAPGEFLAWAAEGGILEPSSTAPADQDTLAKARLKKQRRVKRINAMFENSALAAVDPSKWFARRAIEAALPEGERARGFHFMRGGDDSLEVATCLILHHEQNPLFRSHAAACLYCEVPEAVSIVERAGTHPIPVFWGQGGGEVLFEFLGSFRVSSLLPRGHALYEEQALTAHLAELRARSRRPMSGPQLVLLEEEIAEGAAMTLSPLHPLEAAGGASAWADEILRRRQDTRVAASS